MRTPRRRFRSSALLVLLACVAAGCADETSPGRPYKVGSAALRYVDTSRDRPLDVQLWYPAADDATEAPLAHEFAFRGRAALGAPYRDARPRPLIALSHGDRGGNTNQAWLAEALAANGYIVASVAHWMNTRTRNTPEATLRAWDRPRDVTFVISQLLGDPAWKDRIDPARIGAAGFSSGGYTALALAGARYAPLQMWEYCRGPAPGPDCRLALDANLDRIDFSQAGASYRDARVRAAAALAPALGPGMTAESLRAVPVPVLIAAARDDELVPFEQHAARYAREIPHATLDTLPGGGHFVFMSECTWTGWVFTGFNAYDICGRRHDVDRAAVHAHLSRGIVAFFGAALAPAAATP